jgi:hypothetical protein
MRQTVLAGENNPDEIEDMIYMFNIHKDKRLSTICSSYKDKFMSDMQNRVSQDEDYTPDQLKDEYNKEVLADPYDPYEILSEQERLDKELKIWKLSIKEKARLNHKKVVYRDINLYISDLRLPCYDCIKYYYYYDILESLSRKLFQ